VRGLKYGLAVAVGVGAGVDVRCGVAVQLGVAENTGKGVDGTVVNVGLGVRVAGTCDSEPELQATITNVAATAETRNKSCRPRHS
jgi:hypothetical protein